MKIKIKKNSTSSGEKITRKQGWIACFLLWKFIAPIPTMGKM